MDPVAVDKDVDPAEVSEKSTHGRLQLLVGSQVRGKGLRRIAARAVGGPLEGGRAATDQADPGPTRGKRSDDCSADVPASTGDKGSKPVERPLRSRRRRGACCRTSR